MVSVLLGNGDGTFGPQRDYVAGHSPYSIAIGDLNGDGKPDLAVANINFYTVSVLLGHGDGTFGSRTDYVAGFSPTSVAIGDLDGDGRPDLAAANYYSNTVSVLLGNGNGTFAPKSDYGAGDRPQSVAIGDVNGDGRPDLVVANGGSNSVSVLLNIGGNIPTPTTLALVDARAEPGRVALSWFGASMAGVMATVYRQTEGPAWAGVASIVGDGTGWLRFEDGNVREGARYGYRLGVGVGGSEKFYGETWVSVPGDWILALAAPAPNPLTDRLAISFTLPSATPARLEVIDVAGRLAAVREVGSLGAGPHVVAFTEAVRWQPGIYLVRLRQGARSLIARACIVR